MRARPSERESHEAPVEPSPGAGDVAIVRLKGGADAPEAAAFHDQRSAESRASRVVIDLTGVAFIDSPMLGVLLAVTRQTRASAISTSIVADNPHVRRLLELMLLDRVVALYPSIELALADRCAATPG